MNELSQQKRIPDWAKSALVGVAVYLIPTIFILIYTMGKLYKIGNSGYDNPLVYFCSAAMDFWLIFAFWLSGNFEPDLSGTSVVATILLSSSIWAFLGILLTKWLGFSKGLKVLLVLEISAFCILGLYYCLTAFLVNFFS